MKKNFLLLVIAVLSCFVFTGCSLLDKFTQKNQSETETTTESQPFEISILYDEISESTSDDDGTEILSYSASFPVFTINGYDSSAENINEYYSDLKYEFETSVTSQIIEAADYYESVSIESNYFWVPYGFEETFEMTRGDEICVSMKQSDYVNLGGAHPTNFYSASNFDTTNGNLLSFGDIVSNESAAYTFVTDYILNELSSPDYAEYYLFDEYISTVSSVDLSDRWYFSEDGFVVIFNQYDIAPYAAGMFEFTIPYNDFTYLLDEYK